MHPWFGSSSSGGSRIVACRMTTRLSCRWGREPATDATGGFTISRYHLMTVRIDAQDWREMRFHQECFEIWNDESLKDALRRPHPAPPSSGRAADAPS